MAAKKDLQSVYTKGYWVWDDDDDKHCLSFINTAPQTVIKHFGNYSKSFKAENIIRFTHDFDTSIQRHFRAHFQRKIKLNQQHLVTLQDFKDIAIFTANPFDLTTELINFLHTKQIDLFLRSLLVYFQYYIQIWESFQVRRQILKLPTSNGDNIISDNLSDLRVIVAKNYSAVLLGFDNDVKKSRPQIKVSSDKDQQLYESLICILIRIIWIAFQRKYLTLIRIELNRLLGMNMKYQHFIDMKTTPSENRIIFGITANFNEKKLNQRSPLIYELLFGKHDQQQQYSRRLEYLEIVCTAPEEVLVEKNIGIGILGQHRIFFEPFLIPKKDLMRKIPVREFQLPDKNVESGFENDALPSRFPETESTRIVRIQQCKMWQKYLQESVYRAF